MPNRLKVVDLGAVYHPHEIFDQAQERIEKRFRTGIYIPLLLILKSPRIVLRNTDQSDLDALNFALQQGRVTFNRGTFSGKFNSTIARAMRLIGARFDHSTSTYKIHFDQLPKDTRDAVDTSDRAFSTVLRKLDDRLTEISKIQDRKETPFQDLFDRAIFRADKEFTENVKKVQIKAQLSIPEQEHLSTEWENNMNLWIKGWEAEEIKKLRQQVKQAYFAGDRYGSLLTMITDSYGVSDRKALFLARQETNLLVSGYVQAQYQGNGFPEYRWGCVVGSPEHPVRPYHKALDRTIQRWDSPPVVDKYGNHKHPGQDFGCRCKATPILRVG